MTYKEDKIMAESTETLEEKYLYAARLKKAIHSLVKDKDKADMYREVSKIYKSLGDYKDSQSQCDICNKKALEHEELAKKITETVPTVSNTDNDGDGKVSIVRVTLYALCATLVLVAIGGLIYLKTKPGRYARASYYERIGNYQKSYRMFGGLKSYKDSEARSLKSRYEFANKCLKDKNYTTAIKMYRFLEDYKDSEDKLSTAELKLINHSAIGTNVLYGGYHWLIAEKSGSKVLLVKSLPINGFAYNDEDTDITWHDCSLRSYLNGEFLDETFTSEMQKHIVDTNISVSDNKQYNTSGGDSTIDKVFLLSANEFERYQDILSNYMRDCWLIDPGMTQSSAQFISYGQVMERGYSVTNTNIHIRPALWISVK